MARVCQTDLPLSLGDKEKCREGNKKSSGVLLSVF